ncbi:MAG: glycosyltransferase family 4 protein [Nitrospiraceae bacterium]
MNCLIAQLDVQGSPIDSALAPNGIRGTSRPIKVCFISPLGYGLYRPESGCPFGGAEVQFYLLSKALSEDPTFQVSVLTTVSKESGREQHARLTIIKRKGQDRLSRSWGATRQSVFKILRRYGAAFWEMRDLFREIDADVYLHAGAGVEVGAYALICRLSRRRFVYVVASSADLSEANGFMSGPLRWLYPIGLRLAHAVICRSREQQDSLRTHYGRAGVLIRTGHPSVTQIPGEKSTILWVGRLHPLKQPQMFLDLAECLPNERCVMVAMRDGSYESLLQNVRKRAAALPNVTVHEDVPWREIDQFFAQAKLFVNTSTYEGFPNTFVQAAMHRIPILSWAVDPDGVLASHGIGTCAAGSFDRLVASAEQLCSSDALRAELGHRALVYAREHHDLARSVDELKVLVRTLARQREGMEA